MNVFTVLARLTEAAARTLSPPPNSVRSPPRPA